MSMKRYLKFYERLTTWGDLGMFAQSTLGGTSSFPELARFRKKPFPVIGIYCRHHYPH